MGCSKCGHKSCRCRPDRTSSNVIRLAPIPAGTVGCPSGGVKIVTGQENRCGFTPCESVSICNGASGPTGGAGPTGAPGLTGPAGPTGAAGLGTLQVAGITPPPAGAFGLRGKKMALKATSGFFTIPAGVTRVRAKLWGGGGGGGGSSSANFGSNGGGGGSSAYTEAFLDLDGSGLLEYSVGAGGTGGIGSDVGTAQAGLTGEASWVGPGGTIGQQLISFGGGGGGVDDLQPRPGVTVGSGGNGGVASFSGPGLDTNLVAALKGQTGKVGTNFDALGGDGGGAPLGGPGGFGGTFEIGVGSPGAQPGGGGGAGATEDTGAGVIGRAGANGANGMIIVYY